MKGKVFKNCHCVFVLMLCYAEIDEENMHQNAHSGSVVIFVSRYVLIQSLSSETSTQEAV